PDTARGAVHRGGTVTAFSYDRTAFSYEHRFAVPHLAGAQNALSAGLAMLRDAMDGMLSTALRGEGGGVPRTRGRPHNDTPGRHSPGPNAGPLGGRLPAKPGGASLVEEDTVALPSAVKPPRHASTDEPAPAQTPPPARPDPTDAAAEVWAL